MTEDDNETGARPWWVDVTETAFTLDEHGDPHGVESTTTPAVLVEIDWHAIRNDRKR